MTHFIGAVIVPASVPFHANTYPTQYPTLYGADAREFVPGTELQEFLARALAPFDENMEYEAWIPKDEVIAEGRASIEQFRTSTYAAYIADPVEYVRKHSMASPEHFAYLSTEFPEKLEWTDEQVYADATKFEEPEDIREDGAVRTRYNPASKWDWYTIGGRWEKTYRSRQGEKIQDFRDELQRAVENARDPEAIAELAAVEEEIQRVWDAFNEQRAAVQAWTATKPAEVGATYEENVRLALPGTDKVLTFKDTEAAEAKRLDCRAYFPWWTPFNIVTTTMQDPELGADDEAIYDENGEIVKVEKFEWITQGRMGWFGASQEDMSNVEWAEKLIEILDAQDPESRIVYIDFHI